MFVSVCALLASFYGNGSTYIYARTKVLIIQLAHPIVLAAPACWMYTGRGAIMSGIRKRNFMIESEYVLETSIVCFLVIILLFYTMFKYM